ncbi:MAG: hypothetical protein ABWZ40_05990 [Caulobacterales bacterium]
MSGTANKSGWRLAVCAAAFLAFGLSACQRAGDKTAKDVEGPDAPSPAEVERNAVADFTAPQAGVSPPNPNAAFEGPFTGGGMEPFWAARIEKGKLTLQRPEAEPVTVSIGALKPKDGVAKVTKNKLTLIVTAQPCTDPSGMEQAYRMLVVYSGDAYEGCARVGEPPKDKDWSAELDAYLPAIDACLTKARAQNIDARVTVAYPRTRGHTGVRLSGADGRWECDAKTDGGAVSFLDPIGEEDVLPGEWAPLFTRAPGLAPEGKCNRNVEAKSAGGAALGWLTYESC